VFGEWEKEGGRDAYSLFFAIKRKKEKNPFFINTGVTKKKKERGGEGKKGGGGGEAFWQFANHKEKREGAALC